MKLRKFTFLILLSTPLLSGCGKQGDTPLLLNSDYLLYGDVSENHLYYQPTLEEFDNLYNSNLNYIILFSEDGCTACDRFKPIIEEYILDTHYFVVKVDGNDRAKIENKYRDVFFKENNIKYPSLIVKENSDNFYNVDYSSYMRTYRVFSRHMKSRYKTSKCAYFCGEISGKSPIISDFTLVNFESNDVFKNRISSKLLNTEKNVLIKSNFNKNSMTVFEKNSDNQFVVKMNTEIDEKLDDETIEKYL